ncbi:MAG: flavin reductase [Treponema sp.]|jgi:flavin reductase (DIM6/NTAB) family NADH-FMN oxidoreductase RutF/rubredoxin|nr:flavin reductase [Treponema sp.]
MDTMALRNLSCGLFIAGARDGGRLTGCTVNSVMQVTSDPVMISVCVNHKNFTNQCIRDSGGFSVSILSEDAAGEVIGVFGFHSGRDTDKFASIPCDKTAMGFPVLRLGVCGWLECSLESFMELPTHTLFIGRLTDAKTSAGSPMTYAYYHRVIKGKTPVNAPTYEKPLEGLWTCPLCGYQYDGSAGPFEGLPEGWTCPICGQPKNLFGTS